MQHHDLGDMKTYGWGLQIPNKEVEPFLSADCKSAGTPSGLALLITPNGLASLYYGLTEHPLFLLLENIGYVGEIVSISGRTTGDVHAVVNCCAPTINQT